MTPETPETPETMRGYSYADAERDQLLAWVHLDTAAKIAFFEEMLELAWRSGALAPERLALRDCPATMPAAATDPGQHSLR